MMLSVPTGISTPTDLPPPPGPARQGSCPKATGCCWDARSITIAAHNILEYFCVQFDSGSVQKSHWGRREVQKAAEGRGLVLFPG